MIVWFRLFAVVMVAVSGTSLPVPKWMFHFDGLWIIAAYGGDAIVPCAILSGFPAKVTVFAVSSIPAFRVVGSPDTLTVLALVQL